MSDSAEMTELFRKNMSRVRKQKPIVERDFLYLCKEAVDLVNTQWQDREIIANRIASIWFEHSKELAEESNYIGNLFSDLDLPDKHAQNWTAGKTVRELWDELDHIVMYAIHHMETKTKD